MKCLNCEKQIGNERTYCSNRCQARLRYKQYIARWLVGDEDGKGLGGGLSAHIKRWFAENTPHECTICSNGTWQGEKIPLIHDHIDGNADNNVRENLRRICPNCDAQLPTYKGRNRGNGRHVRRERYRAGKSW